MKIKLEKDEIATAVLEYLKNRGHDALTPQQISFTANSFENSLSCLVEVKSKE